MEPILQVGFKHAFSMEVKSNHLVPALFPESEYFRVMPSVFATGYLVGFVEWACIDAMHPRLPSGYTSLGTHANLSHSAPTPQGHVVTAAVELLEQEGARYLWQAQVSDGQDRVCEGTHERFVVQEHKFLQRVAVKANEGKGRQYVV